MFVESEHAPLELIGQEKEGPSRRVELAFQFSAVLIAEPPPSFRVGLAVQRQEPRRERAILDEQRTRHGPQISRQAHEVLRTMTTLRSS
jgi:hypothetical protein